MPSRPNRCFVQTLGPNILHTSFNVRQVRFVKNFYRSDALGEKTTNHTEQVASGELHALPLETCVDSRDSSVLLKRIRRHGDLLGMGLEPERLSAPRHQARNKSHKKPAEAAQENSPPEKKKTPLGSCLLLYCAVLKLEKEKEKSSSHLSQNDQKRVISG